MWCREPCLSAVGTQQHESAGRGHLLHVRKKGAHVFKGQLTTGLDTKDDMELRGDIGSPHG